MLLSLYIIHYIKAYYFFKEMRDKFMNDLERVYQEVFEESSSKDKLDYKNKKSNRTLSNFKNTLKEIKKKI